MKRIISAAVWLCSWIGSSMAAQMVWDITPLDPTIFPGGFTRSNVWSINNNRQIIGEVWKVENNIAFGHTQAVWDFSDPKGWGVSHTMVTEVESMYLQNPHLYQINDNGQVCGGYTYAYPGEEKYWAFFWRPMMYDIFSRTVRDLGSLGDDEDDEPFLDDYRNCYESFSFAINNAGTIVGKSTDGKTNNWGLRQIYGGNPTVWEGVGMPISVGDPNCYLCGINNQNIMIGSEFRDLGFSPDRAFIQTGRNKTWLPLPDGCADWISSAHDINDQNMIVGTVSSAISVGILWHPTEGIVQLPNYPGDSGAIPRAINNQGTIVGESGGAVVWIGAGNNYQVVNLNMFKAQTGWQLIDAYDINDEGWIVGRGRFDGKDIGFLARPRLDENPPIANLDATDVKNEGGQVTIGVLYYDDNGMNSATMDDKDIQVVYPDGTKVAATFGSVEELDPEPETGKRKYQAKYSFSTPPMNPMNPDGATLRILVAESEVSDLSGRYVPKGLIGELELSFPPMTASILKGSTLDTQTSTTTWKFQTHLYSVPANPLFQILSVKFQTPGGSTWYNMTSSGNGIWSYIQTASSSAALNGFGSGDYTYRMTIDFGGPMEFEHVFRFGIDEDDEPIPAPTTTPSITAPQNGSTIGHKNINLSWAKPNDPAITSMICSVMDTAKGNEVFNKVILNGTATTAGTATLMPDRDYRMTVYFCAGDQNRPEEDDWASYTLKYTATTLEFATQPYAGDINDDGIVDLNDLSLLSQSWKKTSGQAGWDAQCDLQPNGMIDLGDLLMIAQNWMQ